jgi:hypothetical protein
MASNRRAMWFLNAYRGHVRMWHSGETIGFRTDHLLLSAYAKIQSRLYPRVSASILFLASRT